MNNLKCDDCRDGYHEYCSRHECDCQVCHEDLMEGKMVTQSDEIIKENL